MTHCRPPVRISLIIMLAAFAAWPVAGAIAQPANANPAADRDYFFANTLFKDGKWQLAAEEFARFVKNHPTHPRAGDAQLGLAESLLQTGKHAEAADAFKTLLANSPQFASRPEIHYRLGQAWLSAGRQDEGMAALVALSAKFKEHYLAEWADARRAQCLVNLNRHAEAEPLLSPLVEKYLTGKTAAAAAAARKRELMAADKPLADAFDDMLVRVEFNLAMAQYGQAKYGPAEQTFAKFLARKPAGELADSARFCRAESLFMLKRLDDAVPLYDEVIKGKGSLASLAGFRRALTIYTGGDLAKAAPALAEAARDKSDPARAITATYYLANCLLPTDPAKAVVHLDAVLSAVAGGELKSAADAFKLDEVRHLKAVALLRLKKNGEAETLLADTIRQFPQSARMDRLKFDLANAMLAQDKFAAAAGEYDAFATKFPQHESAPRAIYLAAYCQHRAGRQAECDALCAKFLSAYAKDPLAAKVAVLAGDCHFTAKDYAKAADAYARLFDASAGLAKLDDPEFDQPRLHFAWSLYLQKKHESALAQASAISAKADDKARSESAYLRANCLLELGRGAEAAPLLDAYLSAGGDKPYSADAMLKRAMIEVGGGDAAKARPAFEKFIRQFPDNPQRAQAEFHLAELCLEARQYDDALAHYREFAKRDSAGPLGPAAAFGIGLCYDEQSQYKQAADAFATFCKVYPQDERFAPQAMFRQGLALGKLGQHGDGEKVLAALVEKFARDPLAPQALRAIGLAQEKQEQFEKAAATFARLIKEFPADKQLDQAWYELAWCQEKLKDDAGRAQSLTALHEKFPDSPLRADACYFLAERQYQKKEYDAAAMLYENSLAAAKDERLKDKALYRLGWCKWLKDRLADAATQFDRLAAECPNSDLAPDAMLHAGEAYLKIGKPSESADRLSRLLSGPLGKKLKADRLATANLRLGEAQLVLGQADKALVTLRALRDSKPDDAMLGDIDCNIGRALFDLKKFPESAKALEQALAKAGAATAAKAQFYLAETLLSDKKDDEAEKAYLKAAIVYEAYAEWAAPARFQLVQIYLKKGDRAEANRQIQELVSKFANTKYAELAKKQLQ